VKGREPILNPNRFIILCNLLSEIPPEKIVDLDALELACLQF